MTAPILAAVSGGLDSVAMAWLLLQGQEPLHIHHVMLRSSTSRDWAETAAMSRIVPWLREHARPFGYSQSSAHAAGLDIVVVTRECALMCRRAGFRPQALARGSNAHDMERTQLANHRAKADAEWAKHWGEDPPPVTLPIAHMRKAELWTALPEPLRALTWSCRRPVFEGDQAKSCGECRTCREIADDGVPLNTVSLSH